MHGNTSDIVVRYIRVENILERILREGYEGNFHLLYVYPKLNIIHKLFPEPPSSPSLVFNKSMMLKDAFSMAE